MKKIYRIDNNEFVREASEEEFAASESAIEAGDNLGTIIIEIDGEPVKCTTERSGPTKY